MLQTGLKIHWSRRSASSCFNRVWNVTKSSAKHHSMLRPWVLQHQPWPSPSAWTKTRFLHGCRNFYLLILPSLSFSFSFSLSLLLLLLDRTDVCSILAKVEIPYPTPRCAGKLSGIRSRSDIWQIDPRNQHQWCWFLGANWWLK